MVKEKDITLFCASTRIIKSKFKNAKAISNVQKDSKMANKKNIKIRKIRKKKICGIDDENNR